MKAREIRIVLPHPALADADWADCFETLVPDRRLTAEAAARKAFGRMPAWARALMALRNLLVRPFGLKGDPAEIAAGVPRAPHIGMFPVVSQTGTEMVLGFDDRHLDFRIVVETKVAGEDRTSVRLMTLVRRNNLLGRAYLAAIMPFHKLIVASLLSRIR